MVSAIRIPLDSEISSPYLQSTMSGTPYSSKIISAPFSWSNVYLGLLLHKSLFIEVGPRGAWFVLDGTYNPALASESEACFVSPFGLCHVDEGIILPSLHASEGYFPVASDPSTLKNSLLRHLAQADACRAEGKGRGRVYSNSSEYTVTACDVLQGVHLVVYRQEEDKLSLHEQTFGPSAYLVILVSATINICAFASCYQKSPPSLPSMFLWNAGLSVLACTVLYFRNLVHFQLMEDEIFFWVSAVLTFAYLGLGYLTQVGIPESFIFSLTALASVLYRTNETPYAIIIAYILGYILWNKILGLCHGQDDADCRKQHVGNYIDLFVLLLYVTIFCEISLRPQCLYQKMWPIYYTFHIFVCYSIVKYQQIFFILPDGFHGKGS